MLSRSRPRSSPTSNWNLLRDRPTSKASSSSEGTRPERAANAKRASSMRRACLRRCRGPQSSSRRLSRMANTELRVRLELHVSRAIILFHGIKQAEDAGMDQVFQVNVLRQSLMNLRSNELHLRI